MIKGDNMGVSMLGELLCITLSSYAVTSYDAFQVWVTNICIILLALISIWGLGLILLRILFSPTAVRLNIKIKNLYVFPDIEAYWYKVINRIIEYNIMFVRVLRTLRWVLYIILVQSVQILSKT